MPDVNAEPPPSHVPTTVALPTRRRRPWLEAVVGTATEGLPFANFVGGAPLAERNAFRLYADLLWTSVFSAVAAFNGAFALRLGGSNELVGLLSSLPFLVVALLTLPFSRIVERTANRVRLVSVAILLHRAGFLLVALLPFAVATGRAEAFVALCVLMTVPAALVNVTFHCLFADVVAERARPTVVTGRMIIASGVVMALTPLFGRWLDGGAFPLNYQALYLCGFLASLLAVRAIARIEATPHAPPTAAEPGAAPRPSPIERLIAGWRMVREQEPFARILLNTLLHTVGAWIATPLYVIYFVRHLGAPDSWIGVQVAVASLAAIVGYTIWRPIIVRRGEGLPLRLTIVLTAFYPIAVALTHDLSAILVLAAVNGLIQPGLNTSHYSVLLKTCPRDRMPTFISVYITAMNVGAFVGPLIGVALIGLVGINVALACGGGLWLLGGILFWILPVRPRSQSAESA